MKEKAKITKNIAKSYSKIAAKIEKSKWYRKENNKEVQNIDFALA
ncbi:hypothetical protein ACTFOB_08865 [Bacillus cereus group sp. MYBK79-1]